MTENTTIDTPKSQARCQQPRLVRLCRFCAQKLDLWMEWKNNHCLYDHATSKACDECNGQNLRNPESVFTVKFRLPNDQGMGRRDGRPPRQDG